MARSDAVSDDDDARVQRERTGASSTASRQDRGLSTEAAVADVAEVATPTVRARWEELITK